MLTQEVNQDRTITINPHNRYGLWWLSEIWEFRELFLFLAWRDIKVRYKQTVIGLGWVALQPMALMLVFTFVFGRVVKVPSEGVPYHQFALAGLVPWLLFASVVNQVSNSLVSDARIISKVYFPRLIVPLAASLSCLLDALIHLALLLSIFFVAGGVPSLRMIALPLWLAGTLLTALAVSIGLSALNAKFRDFRYVIPFGLQLMLFLTPVLYSSALVPDWLWWVYVLNPMALMVDGFRWALLGVGSISGQRVLINVALVTVFAILSLRYFRSVEDQLADVL
ncbi:MAG: ABC transporter permease [Burkholderiales bacterium]|nr:ABC transporter permease [Burkholderiales bacterium]